MKTIGFLNKSLQIQTEGISWKNNFPAMEQRHRNN